MSYDVLLKENNGDTVHFDKKYFMAGGTYAIGGNRLLWRLSHWKRQSQRSRTETTKSLAVNGANAGGILEHE